MNANDWLAAITAVGISVALSAFFSGIEIAFVTSSKLRIELDKKLGALPASIYSFFHRHQPTFLSALLVGNNAALVVYGIFMGKLLEPPIEQLVMGMGGANVQNAITLLAQTAISTLFILVFAEFLPKVLFRINPNAKLKLFTVPVVLLCAPLFAAVWLISTLLGYVSRLVGIQSAATEYNFSRIDLDHYVREAVASGSEESEIDNELQIIQNALDFSRIKARECMVPRNEIVAVDFNETVDHLQQVFIETGYSKVLVYKENIDNIIGYAHRFEMFRKPQAIKNMILPLTIVPETATADKVMRTLLEQKKNVALVVDEYGGTSGMLTLEDIVEEIFGEIEDEHDEEELVERVLGDGHFQFSARLEIDYLNSEYGLDLPEGEDYETLAGLIIHENEDLPEENETIEVGNYIITINRVSDHKIDEVSIRQNER